MAFPADQSQVRRIVIPATGAGADVTCPILLTEACFQQILEIFDADGPHPAQNGGGDIRISSDGTTRVACDVRSFVTDNDPANGRCEIHVLHTSKDAEDTELYIHWGTETTDSQPAADDTYGSEAVYPSSALAVWNMDQDPSGSAPQILDATSNDRHATSQGSMASDDVVPAAVGDGLDFDGSNDALTASVTGITATHTQEVVLTTGSFSAGMNRYIMDMGTSPSGNVCWFQVYDANSDGVPTIRAGYAVAGTSYIDSGFALSPNTTYHIVVTRNSSTKLLAIYIDGDLKNSAVVANTATPASVHIGRYAGAGAFFQNGNISLASIWNTNHPAAWAAVRHATLLSPGTFASAVAALQPTGIPSGAAFGTASVSHLLTASGIAAGEASGTATVSHTITAAGIHSGAAFGTASVSHLLTASGIAAGEAFGTASVPHTITAAGIAATAAFGTPAASHLLTASGIASGEVFGSPVLEIGDTLQPTGIGSGAAFGAPSVGHRLLGGPTGCVIDRITQHGIANTSLSFNWNHTCSGAERLLLVCLPMQPGNSSVSTITYDSVDLTLAVSGGTSSHRVRWYYLLDPPAGEHLVDVRYSASTSGIRAASISLSGVDQSAPIPGTDTDSGTAQTIVNSLTAVRDLSLIFNGVAASGPLLKLSDGAVRLLDDPYTGRKAAAFLRVETAGAKSVSWFNTDGSESYGSATLEVAPSVASLAGSGIPSGATFGQPALVQTLTAQSIESGAQFGLAALPGDTQTLSPTGISPEVEFGSARLNHVLTAAGVPSGETFGTATVSQRLSAAGIPPVEAHGVTTVVLRLSGSGIAPTGAAGSPSVRHGLTGTGIAPGAAFGETTLRQQLVATAIPPGAAFGVTTVSLRLGPQGITSGAAFGQPALVQTLTAQSIESAAQFGSAVLFRQGTLYPAGIEPTAGFGMATLLVRQQVLIVGTLTVQPAMGAAIDVGVELSGTFQVRPSVTAGLALEVLP